MRQLHIFNFQSSIFNCLPLLLLGLPQLAIAAENKAVTKPDPGLPYVYTKWEQLTTKQGLPNDHIFAVKVDGNGASKSHKSIK